MRSEAAITVTCDRCMDFEEEIELTAIARGGFDLRNVAGDLKRSGWRVDDEGDICPNCVEDEEATASQQTGGES